MLLPKPKGELGYSGVEIYDICKKRKIDVDIFWEEFGVNTVAVGKDGMSRFYPCDVERTLYNLGHKDGVNHLWD